MNVGVRIEGAEKTRKVLAHLDMAARRRVVSAAVRAGNKVLITTARRLAPVDTGNLRRQISGSVKNDRTTGTVTGLVRAKRTKAMLKKRSSNAARYLHLVTGGTRPHLIPDATAPIKRDGTEKRNALVTPFGYVSRIEHPGTRPQPFMDAAANVAYRPALSAFEKQFAEKMRAETAKVRGGMAR